MIQKYRITLFLIKIQPDKLYYDTISKGHCYDKNTFIKTSWRTAHVAETVIRTYRDKT